MFKASKMNSMEKKNESIIPFGFYFNGVLIRGYRVYERGDRVPLLWKTNYYLIEDLIRALKNNIFDDADKMPVYIDQQKTCYFCVEHQRLLNVLVDNCNVEDICLDVEKLCLSLFLEVPRFDFISMF